VNRVDVEASVFQPENMQFLNGEYEAFIYDGGSTGEVVMRVSVECSDPEITDRRLIEDCFVGKFLKNKKNLVPHYEDRTFSVMFNFVNPGELELYKIRGRPKRLIDRRSV
jgi:phenylacetate-coenzyme A ligase PaaK-like adenylate-forming protein